MHSIAAKAVAFYEAMQPEFKVYAKQILKNTSALADELQKRGFYLVTGGTSNHLILADVQKSFGIDGKVVQTALDAIGLNVNANTTPDDTGTMYKPSGVRLGTAAITTRGFVVKDMEQIADWMKQAIDNRDNLKYLAQLKSEVTKVARAHP